MINYRISHNEGYVDGVTIGSKEQYTGTVQVNFIKYTPDSGLPVRNDEMFLTPDQLEDLGEFLIRQAIALSN